MKISVRISLIFLFALFISCDNPDVETNIMSDVEVKDACSLLNAIRENPSAYSSELGVNLDDVKSQDALIWDSSLANAAYKKAKDMADNNYFAHIDTDGYGMNFMIQEAGFELADYLKTSISQNNFESIAAGTNSKTPSIMIKQLIIDKNVPSLGHRKHLLGMNDFYAACKYIGIGFYKKPESHYTYYCCVLIARHK